jgi:regulator of protease activity HflC (stomatin/prohibitin superfamily)
MKKVILFLTVVAFATSCTTVEPGHKGVEVSWGGKTNVETIYAEGMHTGIHWVWDNMVEYDVREKTMVQKFEFNDKNNMLTGVELALDYNLSPTELGKLHTKINDYETKIAKTVKSAAKEVIPQYTASELNLTKRSEAEQKISDILSRELPEFYINFARIQLTDVDIPQQIAQAAEATAKQLEINKLELEKVQAAENRFKAAEYDAKTKDILSQPKMLALYQLELQEKWINKWNGSYGTNNVFGGDAGVSILKGSLK